MLKSVPTTLHFTERHWQSCVMSPARLESPDRPENLSSLLSLLSHALHLKGSLPSTGAVPGRSTSFSSP